MQPKNDQTYRNARPKGKMRINAANECYVCVTTLLFLAAKVIPRKEPRTVFTKLAEEMTSSYISLRPTISLLQSIKSRPVQYYMQYNNIHAVSHIRTRDFSTVTFLQKLIDQGPILPTSEFQKLSVLLLNNFICYRGIIN